MSLATSNVFALLNESKKKKKSSKDDKKKKKSDKKHVSTAELEKAIFSQPSINITSWADEEDDDYALPPLPTTWDQVRAVDACNKQLTISRLIARICMPADGSERNRGRGGSA
jgi:hypothetical protein